MVEKTIKIVAINQSNIFDRLRLCWGHLDDWESQKSVQRSREWLEEANSIFTPTTFIAYDNKVIIGMIEFLPQKLVKEVGLCPCRVYLEHREVEERYYAGKEFENYLFISCLFVNKDRQHKSVGTALLRHLFNSEVFRKSNGALVYVAEKNKDWDEYIHWPAGSKNFYLKAEFMVLKYLKDPDGLLLYYPKGVTHDR